MEKSDDLVSIIASYGCKEMSFCIFISPVRKRKNLVCLIFTNQFISFTSIPRVVLENLHGFPKHILVSP